MGWQKVKGTAEFSWATWINQLFIPPQGGIVVMQRSLKHLDMNKNRYFIQDDTDTVQTSPVTETYHRREHTRVQESEIKLHRRRF